MTDRNIGDIDTIDADAAARSRTLSLTDLGRVPLARWRWVVGGAVLGLLAVVAYLVLIPARYTATTVVTVRPVVADPFIYPGAGADRVVNMNVEIALANGDEVIEGIAEELGQTPGQVRAALTVEAPVGGQILRFSYVANSAEQARAGANTAAARYLEAREHAYTEQRDTLLESYDSSIEEVTNQLAQAQEALETVADEAGSDSAAAAAAAELVRILNSQLASLTERRGEITAVDLTPGRITRPAENNPPSSHDAAIAFLIIGFGGGAFLGALAAFAREATDRRVRGTPEAVRLTGLPVIGAIRRPSRWGGASTSRDANRDTGQIDVRYLALSLTARLPGNQRPRTLVVLSARDDEGRSRLVADLAVALAGHGHHVYLCDPTRGASSDKGTTETTSGARAASQSRVPALAGAAGTRSGSPAGVVPDIASDDTVIMSRIDVSAMDDATVTNLKAVSDDAPLPALPDAGEGAAGTVRFGVPGSVPGTLSGAVPPDAVVLVDAPAAESDEYGVRAAQRSAAVVVVSRDRTRTTDLRRLAGRLRSAGAEVLGLVMIGDTSD